MSNRVADEGRARTSSRTFENDYHYQHNRRKIKGPVSPRGNRLNALLTGRGIPESGRFVILDQLLLSGSSFDGLARAFIGD